MAVLDKIDRIRSRANCSLAIAIRMVSALLCALHCTAARAEDFPFESQLYPPPPAPTYAPPVTPSFAPPAAPSYALSVTLSYSPPISPAYPAPVALSDAPPIAPTYAPPMAPSYAPMALSYALPIVETYQTENYQDTALPTRHSREGMKVPATYSWQSLAGISNWSIDFNSVCDSRENCDGNFKATGHDFMGNEIGTKLAGRIKGRTADGSLQVIQMQLIDSAGQKRQDRGNDEIIKENFESEINNFYLKDHAPGAIR